MKHADRVLILDDDDTRHAEFRRLLPEAARTHVDTAPAAIRELDAGPRFDVVFLDYDLDLAGPVEEVGTGLDVARHLAHVMSPKKWPHRVWVHSRNPVGSRSMAKVMRRAGLEVTVHRFHIP